MYRNIVLPLLAALTLSSGCTMLEPVMGEWELVEVSFGDMQSREQVEGCTLVVERFGELDFQELDNGEIEGQLTYGWVIEPVGDCYGLPTEEDENVFDFEAERDGDEYELDVDDFYEFECERDGDTLECEDDEGDEWIFERD